MTEPYYEDAGLKIWHGDNRDVLPSFGAESFDSIVTDPPYELGFMGKKWDSSGVAYDAAMWAECYRILKPGGYLLSFGGTRTWHRIAVAIEDAGFEVRDSIAWLYGSGFPKSLDVSKAIDGLNGHDFVTDDAKPWEGWGTALKPGFEPIIVARKPLAGTVASNVLAYGTGALNINSARVLPNNTSGPPGRSADGTDIPMGRYPANVLLDDSQAAALDLQSGISKSTVDKDPMIASETSWFTGNSKVHRVQRGDWGGASRFFPTFRYEAKAPGFERPEVDGTVHATVKPLELMRWLVRLVTRRGGLVLDPFAGSGTTGEAALLEGMDVALIEREADHLPLILARLRKPLQPSMFGEWEGAI